MGNEQSLIKAENLKILEPKPAPSVALPAEVAASDAAADVSSVSAAAGAQDAAYSVLIIKLSISRHISFWFFEALNASSGGFADTVPTMVSQALGLLLYCMADTGPNGQPVLIIILRP